MTKTPEEMLAEFEAAQRDLDAQLKELGLPDFEDFEETDMLKDYPPILRAIHEAGPDEVQHVVTGLLENGADPDARSPYGETAVSECFRRSEWKVLRLLIDHGADVSAFEFAPAHLAVLKGGAFVTDTPMVRDGAGRTPFLLACRIGNVAAARALLPETPEDGRVAEPDGEGPVWMAAKSGVPEMLHWTIAHGFEVNHRARFGGTALLEVTEWDDVAAARILLEAGADVSLGENVSEANRARQSDVGDQSVFQKAASVIMARTPMPVDLPDTITTPASAAHSPEMVRLLLEFGADALDFDDECMSVALGTDLIPPIDISAEAFNRHGTARAGRANPEPFLPDFWREQIRTGRSGYIAETEIIGERDHACPAVPVWSFQRFGRTATRLPDGRTVLIAGEHEDHYDPDFCIYADVTVLDGQGGVQHFIYPKDVFPPTDFHTATLLDDHILLIGSLGYPNQRQEGVTQVLRLSLADFSIGPVVTTGDNPGWISRHRAELDGGRIVVSEGKIEPGYRDNDATFALDLDSLTWTRL